MYIVNKVTAHRAIDRIIVIAFSILKLLCVWIVWIYSIYCKNLFTAAALPHVFLDCATSLASFSRPAISPKKSRIPQSIHAAMVW